jgi:hypothetical protein
MSALYDSLTVASAGLYLAGGMTGWLLNLAARRTRRYYPGVAHAGTAIGLLPTYLLLLQALRAARVATAPADTWQLLTLCLVLAVALANALAALYYVLRAVREERADLRLAAAAHVAQAGELALLHAQVDAERAARDEREERG